MTYALGERNLIIRLAKIKSSFFEIQPSFFVEFRSNQAIAFNPGMHRIRNRPNWEESHLGIIEPRRNYIQE